jgi:hypothetical protein
MPEVGQVMRDGTRAADIVREHGVAADLVAANKDGPAARLNKLADLARHIPAVLRRVKAAARQYHCLDTLGMQQPHILDLAMWVAIAITDCDKPPGAGCDALDAAHNLREIGVADIVHNHADKQRICPDKGLRMGVWDIAKLSGCLKHPLAQVGGDAPRAAVEHTRRRRERDIRPLGDFGQS